MQPFGKKEKILLVSHEMTYTGAPRSLLGMADILRDEGYLVSVWTLEDGPFSQEFSQHGFSVEKIDFPQRASESFSEQLQTYNLVIANTIFCASFAAYAKHFTKTILYVREAENIPQLINDCGLCLTDLAEAPHIICVSEYAASFLYKSYNCSNITVIHNYTEDLLDTLKGEISFDAASRNRKMVRFMVSGTIEPRKGQAVAAAAYNSLPPDLQRCSSLHLFGNHPQWAADYWEDLISSANIKYTDQLTSEAGIFYHGEIQDRQMLMELYNQMDVILIPSEDDACSLIALEAAMLGKMILLSENTGAKYLVDPACVVKTGDVSAWRDMMQKCIENPEWSNINSNKNRNAYLDDAVKKIYRKRFLSYVKELLQQKDLKKLEPMYPVSIIVPVYNVEAYLSECLDSLLSQTLSGIEIICVNDGSTDESPFILEQYMTRAPSIHLVNTKNFGYGHAMNIGIREAHGEYIGIVEPDDYIEPHMFEMLYHAAIATSSDIVKADFYQFYGDKEHREEIYFSTALENTNYNRVISPQKEKECFRFILNTWSGIYRRRFIEKYDISHNETPGASYQDNGFWFQGFCQAERIYFIREALYHNRRDNPFSSANNRTNVYATNEEYRLIKEFLRKHPNLEREFIGQYSMKKLHTYLYTLQRIGWEYKKEYLYSISEEFKESERNGEICKDALLPSEWEIIQWMIRDPDDYYNQKIIGKSKTYKNETAHQNQYEYGKGKTLKMNQKYYEIKKKTWDKVAVRELINFDKVPLAPVKVSIIVPVFNVEEYLRECLDSAVNQTLNEIEVICVNDGSTDSSLNILKEYAARDDRVKIIDKDNAGYGHTMNIGTDMASGQYIGIIESDDFVDLNMFSDLFNIAQKEQLDFIKADFNRFSMQDNKLNCNYIAIAARARDCYNKVISPKEDKRVFNLVMQTWSGIYERQFLIKNHIRHNESPGASFQDNGFWFQTFMFAKRIYFYDKPYYFNRRDNPNSSVYNKSKVYCINDEYAFIRKILDCHPDLKDEFIFQYSRKKFLNYVFTYKRLAREFKLEYLDVFNKELKAAQEKQEIDWGLFLDNERAELSQILENPIKYISSNETNHLKAQCKEKDKQLNECYSQLNYLSTLNYEMWNSSSYKMGRRLTAVVRKPKDNKLKEEQYLFTRGINNICHIVMITDDNYCLPTAVALTSMKTNKHPQSVYKIHIFSSNVSNENKEKIRSLEGENFFINIIEVSQDVRFSSLTKRDGDTHVSPAAILKFKIPTILNDVGKVLYLDGDILVQDDLLLLYNTDIRGKYAAVVKDIISIRNPRHMEFLKYPYKYYFNSGMMLLNLTKMRKDNISKQLEDYRVHGINHFMDQDAFNVVLGTELVFVSPRFNFLNKFYEWLDVKDLSVFYQEALPQKEKKAFKYAVILHFGSGEKPWECDMGYLSKLYNRYFKESPFKNDILEGRS